MAPRYPIPAAEHRTEIRVSNSRFIATAGYAPSVDDARALIARVRAEFADASHNVFAYIVGYGASTTEGMSDDGEPGGTAGRPTMAVVRGSGLGDVAVVVTRYFGGTLLGTGGLVRAYGDAAKAVLAGLPRTEKVEQLVLTLSMSYAAYEPVRLLALSHGAMVEDQEFGGDVRLRLRIAADHAEGFERALREQTAGSVVAERVDA
jgi:uncharacterized YigZ family protein